MPLCFVSVLSTSRRKDILSQKAKAFMEIRKWVQKPAVQAHLSCYCVNETKEDKNYYLLIVSDKHKEEKLFKETISSASFLLPVKG